MFLEQVAPGSFHLRGLPGLMPIVGVWTRACLQASGPRWEMEISQEPTAGKAASIPEPCQAPPTHSDLPVPHSALALQWSGCGAVAEPQLSAALSAGGLPWARQVQPPPGPSSPGVWRLPVNRLE